MKNNRTIRRRALTALTLFWMLFIFIMSSARSTVSDYQSDTLIDFICTVFVKGYTEMPPDKKLELQDQGTFPVRKCAHMTEYAILGALLSLTITEYMQDSDSSSRKRDRDSLLQKGHHNTGVQNNPAESAARENPAESAARENPDESDVRDNPGKSTLQEKNNNSASKILRRAVFIGFLYASTDEFHQTFVPGRSGEIRDILIDTFGVLLGALIVTRLIPSLLQRRRANNYRF